MVAKEEKKKILYVDDEPQLATIMESRFSSMGYEVVIAANGEEGVKKALETKPHAIILDQLMPGMDGIETCRKIKALPELESIPIIIFTCATEDTLEKNAIKAGAVGIIYKPTISDLFELMKRVLAGEEIDWREYKNYPNAEP